MLIYFIFQQVNGKELRSFYVKRTLRFLTYRIWHLAVPTTVKMFIAERKSDFIYVKCFQYFSWCEDHRMNANVAFISIWISKYITFFYLNLFKKNSPRTGTVNCNSSRSMKELRFTYCCSSLMKVFATFRYLFPRIKRFNKCLTDKMNRNIDLMCGWPCIVILCG